MFCKKCGMQLDDDALFCENCGTAVKQTAMNTPNPTVPAAEETAAETTPASMPATEETAAETTPASMPATEETAAETTPVSEPAAEEASRTKGKAKKSPVRWIVAAAVALIVVIAAISVIALTSGNGGTDSFYSEMNYNNVANFAYDDSRLYFIAKYDDNADGSSVFSTDYNGINKRMICDNDDIIRIRVTDGKVYYLESTDDSYNIGVMNTDGSEGRTIVSTESSVSKYAVGKDSLYYLTDAQLFSCNMEGEENRLLVENVSTFVLGKNVLYYVSDDVITAFDLEKETSTEICRSAGATDLALDKNTLYFACDSGLSCVDLSGNGSVTRVINDSKLDAYVFSGEYIYYKHEFDTDQIGEFAAYLAEDNSDVLTYKLMLIGTGELYQANIDGSGAHGVENTDDSIVFSLYTYPDGLYYKFSAFSSNLNEVEFE